MSHAPNPFFSNRSINPSSQLLVAFTPSSISHYHIYTGNITLCLNIFLGKKSGLYAAILALISLLSSTAFQ